MNQQRIIELVQASNRDTVLIIINNTFRVSDNHVLQYVFNHLKAKSVSLRLLLHKEENERNNQFLLQGISNFKESFSHLTNDIEIIENLDLAYLDKFDLVVSDMIFLKEKKAVIEPVISYCKNYNIGFTYIETNTIVPVTITSPKEEYAARTIRKKIWNQLPSFIDSFETPSSGLEYELKAYELLEEFIENKLINYDKRNDPGFDYQSSLSPYLKYGFISPLTIYNRLSSTNKDNKDTFLEELIIRRELAYNFVYYNQNYDQFDFITYDWAYQSMNYHEHDQKEYIYTIDDYIQCKTHDIYFNTAMKEMIHLGKMHGYMRMYWAKKIIEWSNSYRQAYSIMKILNNYYFLDGNTPNGYTGIAWCFGKHDRAFTERPIFGKIRYMNQNGLKRKFNMDEYVKRIEKEVLL